MTNERYTLIDLTILKGIADLQHTVKELIGDNTTYNSVCAHLSAIETLTVTPGASEMIDLDMKEIEHRRSQNDHPSNGNYTPSPRFPIIL